MMRLPARSGAVDACLSQEHREYQYSNTTSVLQTAGRLDRPAEYGITYANTPK